MKSRMARLGVLLVPVFAIMASLASPAEARQAGAVAVTGTATVAPGLAYPCFPAGDLTKCPVVGAGNSVEVKFSGSGAGALTKEFKPPKCPVSCVEAGTFTISATGSVSGWCGLSTGTLSGSINAQVSLGTKANDRTFNVTFVGLGGLLVLTGTTSQGETIAGTVAAVPNTANGSSCTNKAAKDFVVAGAVAIFRV